MKIVIDANVYASSLMKPEGTIGKLFLTLFQDHDNYTIVTSPEIFLELERILKYPKIRNRIVSHHLK
jgi:putative PIN family toxin of toxin-antitoxin system